MHSAGQGLGEHFTAYGREWLSNVPDATHDQRSRAMRYVASNATDRDDCARLLDMLGLTEGDR